ncbi:MAG: glycosyltransferase family 4 protein [Acidobacteriota bacterium]
MTADRPSLGRVALVVPTFPKRSETFIVRHLAGLLERGVDAHVVCRASPRAAWRELSASLAVERSALRRRVHVDWPVDRRTVVLLPLQLGRCVLRRPLRTAAYLGRALRRHGAVGALRRLYLDAELLLLAPDVVHVEFGTLAVGREDLGELLGCRLVVSFRGFDLNFAGLEDPDYYAHLWPRVDAVHVLGADLHRRAVVRGLPPGVPRREVPPAVDVDRFARHRVVPADGERLEILSCARLTWKKGFDDALRAVRLLVDAGVRLRYRIVGDGELIEALSFTRHALGLDAEVELLGARPPDEIPSLFASADVFLHLAVSEGFCNAVLEAQAAGVPVVASDADGLAENVADGVTGFIVPRRDPRAAAAALERLASDPALRRRLGAAGRERAARFTPEREIEGFLALYRLAAERVAA